MAKDLAKILANYVSSLFVERFKKNFSKVLLTEMIDDYMEKFKEIYTRELISPYKSSTRSDDYSAPWYIFDEVLSYIKSQLNETVGSARFDNNKFSISGISSAPWVDVPSRKETSGLRLFYFYINGTPLEYVVLGKEDYSRMGIEANDRLGRYGSVHMLSMKRYVALKNKYGTSKWPDPSKIRHPFSGKAPVRIFEETQLYVTDRDKYYIKKAIELTLKS
jgi:hypothetical protein